MEKVIKVIDILIGASIKLAFVFATVVGVKGVYLAVQSFSAPSYMQQLPRVIIIFAAIVIIRVLLGVFEVQCSKYVEERNNAAVSIVFSVTMTAFIAVNYSVAGIIAAIAYVVIGGMIPVSSAMNNEECNKAYENALTTGNAFFTDMIMGVDEIIQYGRGQDTLEKITEFADDISGEKEDIYEHEKNKQLLLGLAKSIFSIIIVLLMIYMFVRGRIAFEKLITVIAAGVFSIRES